MTADNRRFTRRQKPLRPSGLLAEPKTKEVFRLLWEDLRVRRSLYCFRQLFRLIFSCFLILFYEKIAPYGRAVLRCLIPQSVTRAFQSIPPLATRLGALTVSTSLVFIFCISIGILAPISTRSGGDDAELKLGAVLLPPGQEDTISESDGYVSPESARFAEPPPDDFTEVPLPSTESYPFQFSPVFLGGDSEESISYIAKTSEQLNRSQKIPDLPAFESKPPSPDAPKVSSVTPKNSGNSGQKDLAANTILRHVVTRGENLWQICRKYKVKTSAVIAYNSLSNPSRLRPGLELFIPGANGPKRSQVFRFPLANVAVTSGYGMRMHPLLHRRLFHVGIDLRAKKGTPVYAAAAGKVVFAHRSFGRGNTIAIDHGNGYKTVYAHLQTILVKTGDYVKAGQRIAKSGRTGRTTGPHLHFEVWRKGHHINPLTVLPPVPRTRAYAQRRKR